MNLLVDITRSQPHAAYAAFTHGLTGRWIYLSCTVPNIAPTCLPLKLVIRSMLIQMGRPSLNDTEHNLLTLPAHLGGKALVSPANVKDFEFLSPNKITEAFQTAIMQHAESSTHKRYCGTTVGGKERCTHE